MLLDSSVTGVDAVSIGAVADGSARMGASAAASLPWSTAIPVMSGEMISRRPTNATEAGRRRQAFGGRVLGDPGIEHPAVEGHDGLDRAAGGQGAESIAELLLERRAPPDGHRGGQGGRHVRRSAQVGEGRSQPGAGHVDGRAAPEALGQDGSQGCGRLIGRHAADVDACDADPGVGLAVVDPLIGGPGAGQDGRHGGREEGQPDDQGEHDLEGERQVALGDGFEEDLIRKGDGLFRMGDGQRSVSPARGRRLSAPVSSRGRNPNRRSPGERHVGAETPGPQDPRRSMAPDRPWLAVRRPDLSDATAVP